MSPEEGGSWDPGRSSEGGRCGQIEDILTSELRDLLSHCTQSGREVPWDACLSIKNMLQLPKMKKIGRMGWGWLAVLSEGFGSSHVHVETPTFPPDYVAAEAAGFKGTGGARDAHLGVVSVRVTEKAGGEEARE